MDSCIFCKIVKKQIPACIVFEDETVLAFLDIAPISKGHTLVIPKQHFERFTDLLPDIAVALGSSLHRLAPRISKLLDADGYNLGLNNGEAAGQIVEHVHWHIIPRYQGDGLRSWPNKKADLHELQSVANILMH